MGVLKTVFSFAMWVLGIALVVGAVLKLFFVDVIVLGHDAMAPTVALGEQAFLWRGAEPQFAEVVVCQHPRRPTELVVGRVVGKPGHVISSMRGRLAVSGDMVETDIGETVSYSVTTQGRIGQVKRVFETAAGNDYEVFYPESLTLDIRPTEVEAGRLYILGDNRAHHGYDSRSFGTVDASTCRGTIFMRFQPTDASTAALGHGWFEITD